MEPLRIVAIGGGTGLSALLHGLKRYAQHPREAEITAVVTVTDDGGSSGRLRREFSGGLDTLASALGQIRRAERGPSPAAWSTGRPARRRAVRT
jgi:2-phospho-L-lactate transferase/gluconeogenesis factor (CofD/UPF0052 family)